MTFVLHKDMFIETKAKKKKVIKNESSNYQPYKSNDCTTSKWWVRLKLSEVIIPKTFFPLPNLCGPHGPDNEQSDSNALFLRINTLDVNTN